MTNNGLGKKLKFLNTPLPSKDFSKVTVILRHARRTTY